MAGTRMLKLGIGRLLSGARFFDAGSALGVYNSGPGAGRARIGTYYG